MCAPYTSLFLAGTAQRTDMREKKHVRSTYLTLFGGSFRTAQRTDMRKKSALVFLHLKTSHFFFVAGFSQRTAEGNDGRRQRRQKAMTAEGGRNARFFLPFLPEAHKKKLYMIVRELEFVVVRMY